MMQVRGIVAVVGVLGVLVVSGALTPPSSSQTATPAAKAAAPAILHKVTAPHEHDLIRVSAPSAPTTVMVSQHASTANTLSSAVSGQVRTTASATSYKLTYASVNGRRTLIRWNPCGAITFRINPARAPRGAVADVRRAFRILSQAMGVRFVDRGTTRHVPTRANSYSMRSSQPAEIVVAWARPGSGTGRTDLLPGGNTLGIGGMRYMWGGGRAAQAVAGYVVFDSGKTGWYRPGFGRGVYAGGLYLHELGHAVSLQHIGARGQAMYPSITRSQPIGYALGDRTGLAKIGRRGGCLS